MLYNKAVGVWRQGKTEDILEKFFLKFTYCSNKIENEETRLRDVESIFRGEKVIGFKGDKKTIMEIENHKKLCKNLLQISKENNAKLSIDLIKQFHYELMKNGCFSENLLFKGERPGEFKKGHYVVGFNDVGSDPSEVEEDLISLVEEINNVQITKNNALKIISYFHCWYEAIHPFADGNGRVGRMLLNYLLIGNNLPPIIIFYDDREEYYSALEYFNEMQEIDKMANFLDGQAYKTWIKDYNIKLKSLRDFLD